MLTINEFKQIIAEIKVMPQTNLQAPQLQGVVVRAAQVVDLLTRYVTPKGRVGVQMLPNGSFRVDFLDESKPKEEGKPCEGP